MRIYCIPGIIAALLSLTGLARGQELDEYRPSGWFLRIGPAVRFNLDARVEVIPPAALQPRVYDNGFVLPDAGGTASGKTWNWGYQSGSQIEGDQLRLDRLDDLPALGSASGDFDPALGGEIIGGFRLLHFNIGMKRAHLGLEIGYGFASTSQDLRTSATGTSQWSTDRYGLGGIVPPQAPYRGSRAGPGPVIDLQPSSQNTSFSPAVSTLDSSLDLDLHSFRFGPVLELDLTPRWGVALGFGYSSVYADAEFNSSESVTFSNPSFPGYPSRNAEHNLSRGDWRLGFYTELRLTYQFTRRLSGFVGGDYQYNSDLEFGDDSHSIEIGLQGTYAGKAGVLWTF